jgi:hypothetical protein
MRNRGLPIDIEALRARTREFIRRTVISAEPRSGQLLGKSTPDRLDAAAKAAGVLTCPESISRVIDQATHSCSGDRFSDRLLVASFLTWVRSFRLYEGANQTCTRAIPRRCSARFPTGVEIGDVHLANMHGEPAGVP